MNRIILIGNGFDLAHGLDTRYTDFIDDLWGKIGIEFINKVGIEQNKYFENEYVIASKTDDFYFGGTKINTYEDFALVCANHKFIYQFKNKFLEQISKESDSKSWVDIEEKYYQWLIQTSNIEKLNADFDEIKKLLVDYLVRQLDKNKKNIVYKEKIIQHIKSPILVKELSGKSTDSLLYSYYQDKLNPGMVDKLNLKKRFPDWSGIIAKMINTPEQIVFLNFNYTDTEKTYTDRCDTIKSQCIHIHGELNNEQNPIIFGYGDELDDDYKVIEKKNKKEYLDHIKSIEYLRTDNYKRLLSFVDSDYYQVFIMGHSCGLSDRTLLNTLFEHDKCVSIKPFFYEYYEKEKNEAGVEVEIKKDNYIELVQNISRNFNDKVKMRDRVVNKTYCTTLT